MTATQVDLTQDVSQLATVLHVANVVATGVDAARRMPVKDEESAQRAAEMLGWIKARLKEIEEARVRLVQPLNRYVGDINDIFKANKAPLIEAETALKKRYGRFYEEQRLERERVLREREEAEQRAAEEAAKRAAAETPANLPTNGAVQGEVLPAPQPVELPSAAPKTRRTQTATVTVKTKLEPVIVDESLIPREYLAIDMPKIRTAVRAGERNIPGVRVDEVPDTAVTARARRS
jgi:hypothetical protein